MRRLSLLALTLCACGSHPNEPTPQEIAAILRYDGSAWREVWSRAFDPGSPTIELHAIWGTSSRDVFAVGSPGLILHYDGSAWQDMPLPASLDHRDMTLSGVWGTSSHDVFAVGSMGLYGGSRLVLHYDGTAWNTMMTGPPGTGRLMGVWGTSSSDVFAVGDSIASVGPCIPGPCSGSNVLILHYDGSAWSTTFYPEYPLVEGGGTAQAVWGTSPTDVFVAGSAGILHYDGTGWTTTMVPGGAPNGLWGTSSSDVFGVGDFRRIVHYDGSAWRTMSEDIPDQSLHAVWGSSSSDVFAVGYPGLILHYDGNAWSDASLLPSWVLELHAIWGSSSTDVYAVGSGRR